MKHTLVTVLGRGKDDRHQGYRTATYAFPDGSQETTPFLGFALARHLGVDLAVVLGTAGSMWGALVEHLAVEDRDEELRLRLMEAEAHHAVDQQLLDEARPLLERGLGCAVLPRIIPYGRDPGEQGQILKVIADSVPETPVSFDLTHGFRHLGMVGFLSALMVSRLRPVTVAGLWYGALDMTQSGMTPVLRLDGLSTIERWVGALDRFDATGNYGVFSPLLVEEGVAADKARCLEEAAHHEHTFNVSDAAAKLRTFLPELERPLSGAGALFQDQLRRRLSWVRAGDYADHQRELAYRYLERGDHVRAAVFGWECLISLRCRELGLYPLHQRNRREEALESLNQAPVEGRNERGWRDAYRELNNLRNALAHGNPPEDERYRPILRSASELSATLRRCFKQLLG